MSQTHTQHTCLQDVFYSCVTPTNTEWDIEYTTHTPSPPQMSTCGSRDMYPAEHRVYLRGYDYHSLPCTHKQHLVLHSAKSPTSRGAHIFPNLNSTTLTWPVFLLTAELINLSCHNPKRTITLFDLRSLQTELPLFVENEKKSLFFMSFDSMQTSPNLKWVLLEEMEHRLEGGSADTSIF